MSKFDHVFKIVVVGAAGVGKTCILARYVDDVFHESHHTTLGVDFRIKTIDKIKLQIWDTAGQERFSAIAKSYYRGAHAILYVFSLTDKNSFISIDKLIEDTKDFDIMFKLLVGNKLDLKNQILVNSNDVRNKYPNIPYICVSAKDNLNLDKAFDEIITNLIEKTKLLENTHESIKVSSGIKLDIEQDIILMDEKNKNCNC